MTVAAVVTAAGLGVRLGAPVPKALVRVGERSLLMWAVHQLLPVADAIVVVAPATHLDEVRAEVAGASSKVTVTVVAGGDTRQASVASGLAAIGAGAEVVLVHDAARAFMPTAVMRELIAAVRAGADGAVPVVPVVDTLVEAPDPDGSLGEPVQRDDFRAIQTPQACSALALRDAHKSAHADGAAAETDESNLLRRYGYRVVAVPGSPQGFKVTSAGDLALAEFYAAQATEGAS